jgi:hypothetical protein
MKKIRFIKRVKIAKGVTLNISKRGAGLSAGPKGMKVSGSAQGRLTGSMGIPGSGLSYRTNLDSNQDVAGDESNSFLMDVADKSAYIAKHGPVLANKEIVRSLLFLFISFIALSAWLSTGMLTSLGFLVNPFLPIYIVFTVLYLKESKRNKQLMLLRMEEHLKNCKHID